MAAGSSIQDIFSNPYIIYLSIFALVLIGAGILLHFIASGISIAGTFSKSVYDAAIYVFIFWIIFLMSREVAYDVSSNALFQLVPFGEIFPNPADIINVYDNGSLWQSLAVCGRIWFVGFQMEVLNTFLIDSFGKRIGFIGRYLLQMSLICLVIVINSLILYALGRIVSPELLTTLFALLIIVGVLAFFVFGLVFGVVSIFGSFTRFLPLVNIVQSKLMSCLLVPTVTTVLVFVIGIFFKGMGWFQSVPAYMSTGIPQTVISVISVFIAVFLLLVLSLCNLIR